MLSSGFVKYECVCTSTKQHRCSASLLGVGRTRCHAINTAHISYHAMLLLYSLVYTSYTPDVTKEESVSACITRLQVARAYYIKMRHKES